jgi:hypothetical protein
MQHNPQLPTLCVDCDEVLAAFIPSLALWHNRVFGTLLQARSFTSTHFAGVPGFGDAAETDAKMRAFFASEEWFNLAPIPGSAEALPRLAKVYNIYLVTARSPQQEAVTRVWLSRHFAPVFCGLRFTGAYDNADGADRPKRSKGEVCAELGALCLVDDAVHYVVEAAGKLPLAICFGRYAWNSNREAWEHPALPENVLRAETWRHTEALLTELARAVAGRSTRPRAGAPRPRFFLPEVDLTAAGGFGPCPWAMVAAGMEEQDAGGGGAAALALPALGERGSGDAIRDALRLHYRARAVIPSEEQLAARGVADPVAVRAAARATLEAALEATPGAAATLEEADGGGAARYTVVVKA